MDSTETKITASRLIEFPGVARAVLPPWRKELSKRVREVQEKRAREAALAHEEAEKRQEEQAGSAPPQLELLPQTELPDVNPIVAAALRRIERAHQPQTTQTRPAPSRIADVEMVSRRNPGEYQPGRTVTVDSAPVTATDRAANSRQSNTLAPGPRATAAIATVLEEETLPLSEPLPLPERTHNLVMVQSPAAEQTAPATDELRPKPKRVIADNDPVLSYLDSVFTAANIQVPEVTPSPVFSRLAAGIVDLLAVAFFSLPFAAIIELQNRNWFDHRVAGTMGGIAGVVMFIYLTVSTALTGRTFGMRLFSLRAIDVKTGLIPTGKQSAGRALLFILSLATLGIGFCYALVNPERQAAHDRLSRTAVVRV